MSTPDIKQSSTVPVLINVLTTTKENVKQQIDELEKELKEEQIRNQNTLDEMITEHRERVDKLEHEFKIRVHNSSLVFQQLSDDLLKAKAKFADLDRLLCQTQRGLTANT